MANNAMQRTRVRAPLMVGVLWRGNASLPSASGLL
jgi:hypothetical protein